MGKGLQVRSPPRCEPANPGALTGLLKWGGPTVLEGAPEFKRGFEFRPLLVFADHGRAGGGEVSRGFSGR